MHTRIRTGLAAAALAAVALTGCAKAEETVAPVKPQPTATATPTNEPTESAEVTKPGPVLHTTDGVAEAHFGEENFGPDGEVLTALIAKWTDLTFAADEVVTCQMSPKAAISRLPVMPDIKVTNPTGLTNVAYTVDGECVGTGAESLWSDEMPVSWVLDTTKKGLYHGEPTLRVDFTPQALMSYTENGQPMTVAGERDVTMRLIPAADTGTGADNEAADAWNIVYFHGSKVRYDNAVAGE